MTYLHSEVYVVRQRDAGAAPLLGAPLLTSTSRRLDHSSLSERPGAPSQVGSK